MQSEYYLNGSHPNQSAGKRIAAGFRILAAAGNGEIETESDRLPLELELTAAGFQILETASTAYFRQLMAEGF